MDAIEFKYANETRLSFVGHEAIDLGDYDLPVQEMMCYLNLPIKMIDSSILEVPQRLQVFAPIIARSLGDFQREFADNLGNDLYDRYVYITAKRLYATPDNVGNRPGWHCDGWGTDDINYIWTDSHPTVFNRSRFYVRKNDIVVLEDLAAQAMPSNNYELPVNSLIRVDSLTVHRSPHIIESGLRTFLKISISKHRYNLTGNSHNYRFNYDWTMLDRNEVRKVENGDFVL